MRNIFSGTFPVWLVPAQDSPRKTNNAEMTVNTNNALTFHLCLNMCNITPLYFFIAIALAQNNSTYFKFRAIIFLRQAIELSVARCKIAQAA
jgi:hypothetical protein